MSITFQIEGERAEWMTGENFVNVANLHALELLRWLGVNDPKEWGEIESSELAALCRRRLWPEKRNEDPGSPGSDYDRLHIFGRRAGYLPEKAADLLKLCERAGARRIVWG